MKPLCRGVARPIGRRMPARRGPARLHFRPGAGSAGSDHDGPQPLRPYGRRRLDDAHRPRVSFGHEWLVIEKNTGQVRLVVNGEIGATVLDLGVNNFSERGLLGIALHPDFDENHFVYLFWSCKAPARRPIPFFPTLIECADTPELGADSEVDLAVPLLGNRVDRFVWDGATSTLAFDRNLIKLRSFQNDAASRAARTRATRSSRREATTTAASSASGRTASST